MIDFICREISVERFFTAIFIIWAAINLLSMIDLSNKIRKFRKCTVSEVEWRRSKLRVAISGVLIEIMVSQIETSDAVIAKHITNIMEKFPEVPIVNETGVWCNDYIAVRDHFKTVCTNQEVIDSVDWSNNVLEKAMIAKFSHVKDSVFRDSLKTVVQLSHALNEIDQFSDRNFSQSWKKSFMINR